MTTASTKPYLIRAIHQWCTDNGYTPYILVKVGASARVPTQFVRDGQIVLDISYEATSNLDTETEYQTAVQNYARAALANHLGTRQLKCTAADSQMIYGQDYALGDIVPVRVEEIGLEATARVASIKIIYESTGRSLCPVFDNFTFKKE